MRGLCSKDETAQGTASWGMTLVINDHIDLLHQFPDGVYQQTLTRELGSCVKASPLRFIYVGCEEGAEAGTVLVHVNVRPPASIEDEDQVRAQLARRDENPVNTADERFWESNGTERMVWSSGALWTCRMPSAHKSRTPLQIYSRVLLRARLSTSGCMCRSKSSKMMRADLPLALGEHP